MPFDMWTASLNLRSSRVYDQSVWLNHGCTHISWLNESQGFDLPFTRRAVCVIAASTLRCARNKWRCPGMFLWMAKVSSLKLILSSTRYWKTSDYCPHKTTNFRLSHQCCRPPPFWSFWQYSTKVHKSARLNTNKRCVKRKFLVK
jgi:hypothetical protein